MSEKEKDIIKVIGDALPSMDERSKGYFLGYAEAMVAKKEADGNDEKREEVAP